MFLLFWSFLIYRKSKILKPTRLSFKKHSNFPFYLQRFLLIHTKKNFSYSNSTKTEKAKRRRWKVFCSYSTQLKWICNKLLEISLSDMPHRWILKRESTRVESFLSHAINVYKFCTTFECENILKHWISITNFKPIYLTFLTVWMD